MYSTDKAEDRLAQATSNLTRTEYKLTTPKKVKAIKVMKPDDLVPLGL